MSFGPDSLDLYKASVRILSDRPADPVNSLFLHNRSYGDDTGLLEIAREMILGGRTKFVALPNNEGERYGSTIAYEANPGKTEYIRRLLALGIPEDRIVITDLPASNTREENTAFIHLSRKRKWRLAAILTQPHQLLRTMLGAVQAIDQSGYKMSLYAIAPSSTDWQQIVKGSQGTEEKPREQHIKDEFNRIMLRQSTGELATFADLFAYWNQRGSLRFSSNLPPGIQRGLSN